MAVGANTAVNSERLKAILDGINRFGRSPVTGGYNRTGFSDEDMAVRRWFAEMMKAEGLAVAWDGVGNVSGRLGPAGPPCVVLGSHLDTVPEGGAFDGALGVAVALECALAIRDGGLPLAHPVEVIATSEEEGRFGGMLGSQALAGLVQDDWLRAAVDEDEVRLWDAMSAQGFDPCKVAAAARIPGSVKAFLELHVEQGPVLESAGVPVGIADCVSGIVSLWVKLEGVANHSGSTPMEMRADAFAGLARIAAAIPDLISDHGTPQSRVTVGKVDIRPNFPHTIPGEAEFSVILRDTEAEIIARLCDAFAALTARVCKQHGLSYGIVERSHLEPVALDPMLVSMLRDEAAALGLASLVMPSGAGHDAQTMQALCPSALIFVPSRHGISHSPQEWTDWDAILKGAGLMLAAATRLACTE